MQNKQNKQNKKVCVFGCAGHCVSRGVAVGTGCVLREDECVGERIATDQDELTGWKVWRGGGTGGFNQEAARWLGKEEWRRAVWLWFPRLRPGSVWLTCVCVCAIRGMLRVSTALGGSLALQVYESSLKMHRSAFYPLADSGGRAGVTPRRRFLFPPVSAGRGWICPPVMSQPISPSVSQCYVSWRYLEEEEAGGKPVENAANKPGGFSYLATGLHLVQELIWRLYNRANISGEIATLILRMPFTACWSVHFMLSHSSVHMTVLFFLFTLMRNKSIRSLSWPLTGQ